MFFLFFYWLIDSLHPVIKEKYFSTLRVCSVGLLLNKHILKMNFEFDIIEVWVRFSVPWRGKSQFMFYLSTSEMVNSTIVIIWVV